MSDAGNPGWANSGWADPAWEGDDCVSRTMAMPIGLAERLAARAELRGLSVSDLVIEYAEEGLRRDESDST